MLQVVGWFSAVERAVVIEVLTAQLHGACCRFRGGGAWRMCVCVCVCVCVRVKGGREEDCAVAFGVGLVVCRAGVAGADCGHGDSIGVVGRGHGVGGGGCRCCLWRGAFIAPSCR